MENNLSEPLNEISEKLTTISEDLKKLSQEQKAISTGKTCPYRRAILWTALVVQLICTCSVKNFSEYIPDYLRIFLALFTYIGVFLAGEAIVYGLIGKKESMRANAEAVQEKYGMTLDELDTYIRKLAHIRILAATIALVTFTIVYLSSISGLTVWLSYALTTFASMAYIRIRGKIKVPKRFFLFDMPRGDPNVPLMKNKEGFFASDYDNNWHRYDTSVLKRERN